MSDGLRSGTVTGVNAVRSGRVGDRFRLGDRHGDVLDAGDGLVVGSGGDLGVVGGVSDLVVLVVLGASASAGGRGVHGFSGDLGAGVVFRLGLLGRSRVGGRSLGLEVLLVDVDASGKHC